MTLAGGQGGTVAVKNVDEPGRAPFYFAGSATADATFTVPADKILVVDHFSTFAEWSSACTPSCFFQNQIRETLVGGGFQDRYFVARPLTSGLASEEEMVRWYLAPGSSVRVGWASRAIGTFHADHFAMSGYYIDAN